MKNLLKTIAELFSTVFMSSINNN